MSCECREAPGVPTWVLCNLATDLTLSYHSSWRLLKRSQDAEVHDCSTCRHTCNSCAPVQCKRHHCMANHFCPRALDICAHLPGPAASLTTAWGQKKGRRDLSGSRNVQPVILSAHYSSTHMQNKLSITYCCKKETSPSQKHVRIFMFKKPKL